MNDRQLVKMLARQEDPPESIERMALIRTALADQYTVVPGPLGPIHVGFTPVGVSSIVPTNDEGEFLAAHRERVGRPVYPGDMSSGLRDLLARVVETGRLGKLPVDLRVLTPFQQEALRVTASIPPGEVRPYGWVAREMGRERAVRAVGTSLARNPVPIAIPCHRVVRSDGALGNYAFGVEMKHDLLEHEGMTEFGTLHVVASDTTGVYCYPSCGHARRIGLSHRAVFSTPALAETAGYRACKVCRPG